MKNKTIKKALAIGMSVLMLASTFTPVSVQAAGGWKQNKTGWWWEEDNGSYPIKSWKISAEPGTILTETVIW